MLSIYICVGSACHLKGSYNIIKLLQQIIEEKQLEDRVEIKAALCLGNCTNAVSARVDEGEVLSLSEENVRSFLKR
jgi:NADH:ubiquinone oxidoreductase subunit E